MTMAGSEPRFAGLTIRLQIGSARVGARPVVTDLEHGGTLISSVFEYVSTSARRLPSRNTRGDTGLGRAAGRSSLTEGPGESYPSLARPVRLRPQPSAAPGSAGIALRPADGVTHRGIRFLDACQG